MSQLHVRLGWMVAVCTLATSGTLLAVDTPTFAGEPPPAPAGPASCPTVGPYLPPEPGNAGLPSGLTLCPSGSITIGLAGALLDGWDVRGGIVVDAPDVTVRRSRVTGDGSTAYGIRTTGKGSVRIEDTTVTGNFPAAAVGGDRWSAERIEIVGVSRDGARLGAGSRLRNSTVRTVGGGSIDSSGTDSSGADSSGVVLRGGGDPVLLEDNTIDAGDDSRSGSAVLLAADPSGPGGSVVVRGNLLGGGRWILRQDGERTPRLDVLITGNRFRRDPTSRDPTSRDPEQEPLRVSRDAVLTDNSYLDGGVLPDR